MDIRVKEKSSCFISEQVRILRLETLLYSRPLSRGSKCFALNFSYFDLRSKVGCLETFSSCAPLVLRRASSESTSPYQGDSNLLHFARFALPLASPNLLPLTLSSNVTTQPIKLVYWRSLFHLFGKTQIHLVFRSTFRRSATLGDAFVV